MSSTVEQIKSRLSVIDVIGSYIKLDKVGSNLKARCPFHNEKTASFFISPAREVYHCFGCGKGGDIVTFVQDIEGVDFISAIKILANKAGVELTQENSTLRSEKARLLALMEKTTSFWQENLKNNLQVLNYLKKRGLEQKTIESFKIGFANDGWRDLCNFLKQSGFSEIEIEKAGLGIKSSSGYYDRFRNRIMFPIGNSSGVAVGFSGRIFDYLNKKAGENVGKYVNSPQTILYDKSQILYGLDKAKVEIRKQNCCILVEGQMDLIMSHQAGFLNTVAVSGTALTEEQTKSIKRLADKLILAFDGDEAGIAAAGRSVSLALAAELNTSIVFLPDALDPADIILKDKNIWAKAVNEAKHVVDFYLDFLKTKNYEERQFKIEVGKKVLPFVAEIKNDIDKAYFVTKIAEQLNMKEEPVWQELKKIKIEGIAKESVNPVDEQRDFTSKNEITRKNSLLNRLVGILIWQKEIGSTVYTKQRESYLNDILPQPIATIVENISPDEKSRLIFEADVYYNGSNNLECLLDELIFSLHEEILKEKFEAAMLHLKKLESKDDDPDLPLYLKMCQEISKELEILKKEKRPIYKNI